MCMDFKDDEWFDPNGNYMKDVTYSEVDISELVTKDPITGEFVPKGKGCLIFTGVDELDATHKVTAHYNLNTGVYTVIDYEGGTDGQN